MQRICSSNFTTVEEVRDCVVTILPEDISLWALKEAEQASYFLFNFTTIYFF